MDFIRSFHGREYQFVDQSKESIERFVCPICQELVYEPVQTSCGHLFCERCLTVHIGKKNRLCPTCREPISEDPHRDRFNEREVRKLRVKCPNTIKGCSTVGDLGDIIKHQASSDDSGCQFQLVKCSNDCGEVVERRRLFVHLKEDCVLRQHKCPHCWYKGTYKEFSTHLDVCQNVPVACPNNCGQDKIRRRLISSHILNCPKEVVCCRYKQLGCKCLLTREKMIDHMADQKDYHLEMALNTLSEITKHYTTLVEVLKTKGLFVSETDIQPDIPKRGWLEEDVLPLHIPCTVKIGIPNPEQAVVRREIYIHPQGSKYEIVIFISHTTLSGKMAWLDVYENRTNPPTEEYIVTLKILNQIEDKNHLTIEMKLKGCNEYIIMPKRFQNKKSVKYIVDKVMFFQLTKLK